ncbi:hypothetical protein JK635_01880 [Neobacillus sp. YIM B02564]|uniref:Uncharacterized protein n=1 Tax=Neobacillus paridis TaxID=2803862 RepID=A0ABS1TII8_9BACI|nr:hypothetical protein [Neobacillus paridis]MBL4950988.1 hypothetical protein [Neobacillus paridis]
MSYLDLFRQRTLSNSIITATKKTINNNFNDSLFVEKILINDIEYDVLITQENKSEDKKLLFKPETVIDIGSVVKWKNSYFLVTDFIGNEINEIYPIATIKLCNNRLSIKTIDTKEIKKDLEGNPILNKFGDPIYITKEGKLIDIPCIVQNTITSGDENKQFPLPQGSLYITLQYQKNEEIQINKTLRMYNNIYKIRNIDYTNVIDEKGIMILLVEQVTSEAM